MTAASDDGRPAANDDGRAPAPDDGRAPVPVRLFAPATGRNRDPIVAILARVLPRSGAVLEIASGTGEHVVHFAENLPGLDFQPSDPDLAHRESIAAWTAFTNIGNVRPPLALDATTDDWDLPEDVRASLVAIVCINMIHISPWASTLGLMRHAGALLRPGGVLYLYGPYRRADVPTAASNEAFDQSLKSRNPAWGLRTLESVTEAARAAGLELAEVVEMPANNLSVVFRRS